MAPCTHWLSFNLGILFIISVCSIPIDNQIEGEPEIICESESLTVQFFTKNPFEGNAYVKGYFNESNCRMSGQNLNFGLLRIPFSSSCPPRRHRMLNPSAVVVETNVIIMFHKQVLTKVDRSLKIQCVFMQAEKPVSNSLDVSMIVSTEVSKNVPMPICTYEVLDGGPGGRPVKYAKIGDAVYHKWTCSGPNIEEYCAIVHSCNVDDGHGYATALLDSNGCSKDQYLLQNLDYINDTMAGKEAHVFKFADQSSLYFNCQIRLTYKESNCQKPLCNRSKTKRDAVFERYNKQYNEFNMDVASTGITVFEILDPETEEGQMAAYSLLKLDDPYFSKFPWCFSTVAFGFLIGGFCTLALVVIILIVHTMLRKVNKHIISKDYSFSKKIESLFNIYGRNNGSDVRHVSTCFLVIPTMLIIHPPLIVNI